MSNWLEGVEKLRDHEQGDEPLYRVTAPSGMKFYYVDEDGDHEICFGPGTVIDEDGVFLDPIQLQELAQIINALYPQGESNGES